MARKIAIQSRTRIPGFFITRFLAYGAAVVGAPFSGFSSLAVIPMIEGVIYGAKKRIEQETDARMKDRVNQMGQKFTHSILEGKRSDSISFDVDLGDLQFGKVYREYRYIIK